ncbi:nucleotide exchange factors-like protein [Schizopora paradoxa]|uniref:Nucleotide exchange factors-like protein n=1 Tax=Schizopora paradoxa TaxID=27342 RepID=A0A0H2SAB9_9AGAM|nr:nucleotide exchange factors-like protein [Schizopora paradoxa]
MQSLLRWGIENSQNGAAVPVEQASGGGPAQPLDPKVIDMILGRPDAELMKEALNLALDETKDEESRLTALDDFEMLIENIDNANDMEKLDMWKSIQHLLQSPSSSNDIKANVLWIIGTAVQNNPSAQNAYLSLPDSPFADILSVLSPSEGSSAVRSKAVYALSGILKHNARAVKLLEESGGWLVLKSALEDPDITVRRKVVFLLNALLFPSEVAPRDENDSRMRGETLPTNANTPVHPNSHASMTVESTDTSTITAEAVKMHGIADVVVNSLVNPVPHGEDGDQEGDLDYEEKAVRFIFTYLISASGHLDADRKLELASWTQRSRQEGKHWDLGEEELNLLEKHLQSS